LFSYHIKIIEPALSTTHAVLNTAGYQNNPGFCAALLPLAGATFGTPKFFSL
jgi:hypothetical protein